MRLTIICIGVINKLSIDNFIILNLDLEMKFALATVATLSLIGLAQTQVTYVTFPAALNTFFLNFCTSNTQTDLSSTTLYTDASPFQFMTGFALGAQASMNDTSSTCFT